MLAPWGAGSSSTITASPCWFLPMPQTISLDLNMEEMDISQAIDFIHRNASQGGTTLPMIYVLGDSLAPVKNNNNLVTLLKANFLRNNIDYLGHKATGCFSNGKNSIDFLGRSSLNNHRETTSSCTRSAMVSTWTTS
uniref:GDSL esterase/lipase n=1 Tax=Zea mays TaxID=4577 RepID=A0A804MD13_MAIZE